MTNQDVLVQHRNKMANVNRYTPHKSEPYQCRVNGVLDTLHSLYMYSHSLQLVNS